MLLGNFADLKSTMTFGWKGVGIEGNERVFRAMLFERVVKGKEAGEVSCICDESCPYWSISAFCYKILGCNCTFL